MSRLGPIFPAIVLWAAVCAAQANDSKSEMDFVGRTADSYQGTLFNSKSIDPKMNRQFPDKRFDMKMWDKHFSPWGRQRAPIAVGEKRDKKMYGTKKVDFPKKDFELARWNHQLADLERQARISTKDRARGMDDAEQYKMQLQKAPYFGDYGEKLSLRDVNRYAFHRNAAASETPIKRPGSGE